MKKASLWVVGEPGVGKTTLVRQLLGPIMARIPKPKWTFGDKVSCAGSFTGGAFDGADTVPYNGAAEALEFWREAVQTELTIFDGDRFSNAKVFEFVSCITPNALCLLLTAPTDVVAARRAARGSEQNESWVRGRKTKSARFFETFPEDKRLCLDARIKPEDLLDRAKTWLKEKA